MATIYGNGDFTRAKTMRILTTAINKNVYDCPNYLQASIYAKQVMLPDTLSESHYRADSVNRCAIIIMSLPCNYNTSDTTTFYSLYRSVIHNCGLRKQTP